MLLRVKKYIPVLLKLLFCSGPGTDPVGFQRETVCSQQSDFNKGTLDWFVSGYLGYVHNGYLINWVVCNVN